MTRRLQKSAKKRRKMVPGRSLGVPGDLPEASREPVGTLLETRRRFWKNLKRPRHVPEHIWRASWVQPGPKIDKKRTSGQKDGLEGRHRKRFSQILYADTVLDRFLVKQASIFNDFWIRSVIARNVNQESSISFLHRWQTLKIIVFSR